MVKTHFPRDLSKFGRALTVLRNPLDVCKAVYTYRITKNHTKCARTTIALRCLAKEYLILYDNIVFALSRLDLTLTKRSCSWFHRDTQDRMKDPSALLGAVC